MRSDSELVILFFHFKKDGPAYTGDNGNAIFQSYLSKLFKKETG